MPDLSEWDEEYERAPVEERGGDVPDGRYQVSVESVALTTAKKTGQPMLKWTLNILGPQCKGRKLFRNNMIASADNIKWLKGDLHTCGLKLNRLSELEDPAKLEELLDITLEVQVKHKGDNVNVYINKRVVLDEFGNVIGDDDVPF